MLEQITTNNKLAYENYIDSKSSSTYVDFFEWRDLIEKVYKLKHFWYMFTENNKITGSLALTLTKHPIMGTYLSTAPFASNGGFHADSSKALTSLLSKASELCKKLNAKYVVIRHLKVNNECNLPIGWYKDSSYATYHLPLVSDPDFFLKTHLSKKVRKKINQSKKNNFHIKIGQEDLLIDFWYVISRSMKELGSPYHSKYYLKTLLHTLKGKAQLSVLYDKENSPACCRLFTSKGNTAFSIHGNSLRKYRHMGAGDYFFWLFVTECYRRGIDLIDMGRSLTGSGNEAWKMKWRPKNYPLSYWYYLPKGEKLPNLNQNNPKLQLLIKTWQKLPIWLLNMIGPRLISGIL